MHISHAAAGYPHTHPYLNDLVTEKQGASAPVATAALKAAVALVDSSGIPDLLVTWQANDGGTASSASISPRQVLIAWAVLALEGNALTLRNVATLFAKRLTSKTRAVLALPDLFTDLREEQVRGRVDRATRRLLNLVDAYPMSTRRRRLTKAEWVALTDRREVHSGALEDKRRRFVELANHLLGAQYDTLPARVRTGRVSVAIDSHFRSAHTSGISARRLATLAPDARISAEPDAGFYSRDITGRSAVRARYGWEDELVVLMAEDPSAPDAAPSIVIGFNTHRPGMNPAISAGETIQHIARRGARLGHVVVDCAYGAADPDYLGRPLRAVGAVLVHDYPAGERGVQDDTGRAVLVDGAWDAQQHPLRFIEWNRIYTAGRCAVEAYLAEHRPAPVTMAGGARMRGATAQAFLSLLAVVGTNARVMDRFHVRRRTTAPERVAGRRSPLRPPELRS